MSIQIVVFRAAASCFELRVERSWVTSFAFRTPARKVPRHGRSEVLPPSADHAATSPVRPTSPRSPDDDADSFEALFRDHYPRLCEFVHGYVRSREVAEDIVQDLFLALWSKRRSRGSAELTTAYLFVAARNRALKHLRDRRVAARVHERKAAEQSDADAGGADAEVRYRETAAAVDAAIAALPDRCREIFLLSRRQHMSYAEIAAALGISVKTVEVQMWRALRKLRGALADYLPALAVALASTRSWLPPFGPPSP